MPKMRPEEELIRQDKAFRNPVVPTSAPAPSTVTKDTALKAAMDQKAEALNNKFPWKGNTPAVTVPASGSTGFETSDGVPIESSFRYADDFYNQIGINNILDNTPSGAMSYQGYLAYNGITDPRTNYVMALDRANEMYARALGTYGASGESLAQGNLTGTGYSEYLTGLAYQQKVANTMQAQSQLRQDLAQTAMQYQKYIQDYNATKGIDDLSGETAGNDETAPGVLNETQAAIVDYLRDNGIVSEADLNTARIAFRNRGYSDEDIESAIKGWIEETIAGISSNIGQIGSLAAGNAEAFRQAYGEGSETYAAALKQLQQKNAELVAAAVKAVNAGDFDSKSFNALMNAARESTATKDKEGNTVYNWDSMDEVEKANLFRNVIKDMFESGDIDEQTYQNANYDIMTETLKNALSIDTIWNPGKKKMVKALEILSQVQKDPETVSEEQRNKLYDYIASNISGDTSIDYLHDPGMRYHFKITGQDVSLNPRKLTELQTEALEELLKRIPQNSSGLKSKK